MLASTSFINVLTEVFILLLQDEISALNNKHKKYLSAFERQTDSLLDKVSNSCGD